MNQTTSQVGVSAEGPIRYLFLGLGAAIPALIGLYEPMYWLHPHATTNVFRVAVLSISFLLAFLCGRLSPARAEIKLAQVLTFVCVMLLCDSFAATDISRAFQGWTKLLVLCLIALLLSRALRNPTTARVFGAGLMVSSVLIASFIIGFYIRLRGWTVPSLTPDGQYKALAAHVGLSLNPIAFTAIISFIAGMCLCRAGRWIWLLAAGLLFVCTVFTASRTPVAVCTIIGLVILIANGIRSRSATLRFLAFTTGAAILAVSVFLIQTASFKQMSDLTSGRWDIWYVALQKFSERPLMGYGFQSVDDDLYVRLPGVFPYIPKYHDGLFPGGYHSQYLGALAEGGLIGIAAVGTLYWLLLRFCWQLAFRKWATWHGGQWALIGGLFLFVRGSDEIAGLFGYANGLADFLAYIFLAIIVSRLSTEEDYARALLRHLDTRSSSAGEHIQADSEVIPI